MADIIRKGTLVLVKKTEELREIIKKSGSIMEMFGKTVNEFHGKLMLTASDERDGLCFMKKYAMDGLKDVYVEIDRPGTGLVPFPAAALDVVDLELFCSDNLDDVVLVQHKAWFEKTFGPDLSGDPYGYKDLKELFKFHGKVLRVDWTETEKQKKGWFVLKKFTTQGWEPVYLKENAPQSGFLLFPQEIMKEFEVEPFFSPLCVG